MAKAKIKDALSITCCLGDHPLQNPRLLPCQHSVCTRCIKTERGKKKRKTFTCPKCQLSIPLTKKDVDKLPEDFLYYIMQETKTRNDCVLCKFEDKKSMGTFQCLDCGDVLCDQCQKGHTRSSQTRLHRVVPMEDIQQQKGGIQAEKQLFCDTHSKPNKPMVLEYYCEDCKVLACSFCTFKEHQPQGHVCCSIDEIHDVKMAAVTDHVTTLLDDKKCMEDFASVLGEDLLHNDKQKEKLENMVHDRANKFIEIIEKIKEETLTAVKEHLHRENISIQAKLKETKNRIAQIDSNVSFTQAFLKHTSKSQLLQHQNELVKKLSNQNQQKRRMTLKTKTIDIDQIHLDEIEVFLTEAFGKIKIRDKAVSSVDTAAPSQLMNEPKVLFSKDLDFECLGDLSVTENEDIVVVDGNVIHVCDSHGKPKERIQCSQLDPYRVDAKGDTLYVSGGCGNAFFIAIDFKGKVKKSIPSPCNFFFNVRAMAVDDAGNVFISSTVNATIYKCAYNETNAKVFIERGKHPDLKHPIYLCLTPGGELHVVVSNCHSNTVQVYDKLGLFLWQYKGQGDMELGQPSGICCDKNYNIYICDIVYDRIQVIQDNKFKGCIKMMDFTNPKCIDMDKDGNIVCGYLSGKMVKLKVWE